jgi:hypothetical protein
MRRVTSVRHERHGRPGIGIVVTSLLLVALVFGIGNAAGTVASANKLAAGARCSIVPVPFSRDTAATYFLAIPHSDTVPASLGNIAPSTHGGHSGPGKPRAVHGQVMRLDTVGGKQDTTVRRAFARNGTREVVIVPWDYDPGCETTYWDGTARWAEPGLVGFYSVNLREREHWSGDRPTFDAFLAAAKPYPHGQFFRRGYRGTDALQTRASLNAREMFSLYGALPAGGRGVTAPLAQWRAQNPELALRYPADNIIKWVLDTPRP